MCVAFSSASHHLHCVELALCACRTRCCSLLLNLQCDADHYERFCAFASIRPLDFVGNSILRWGGDKSTQLEFNVTARYATMRTDQCTPSQILL